MYVAVGAVVLRLGGPVAWPVLVQVGLGLVLAVQAVSFAPMWRQWLTDVGVVLPAAQIVAWGLIDLGTGLERGVGGALLLPPLLTLALRPGPLGITLGLALSWVVLLLTPFVAVDRPYSWLQAVLGTLVVTLPAWLVNAMVEDERRQARDLDEARAGMAERARAARASLDLLTSVIQSVTSHAILTLDHEGRVLTANNGAERLLDRGRAELEGSMFVDLLDREEVARRREEPGEGPVDGEDDLLLLVLGSAVDGGTYLSEWPVTLPDGTTRPLEIVATPRATIERLPPGYLLVGTDVSARYEEQRRQDEFIGLVSHELRTPLVSILGYLELLRLDPPSWNEEQRGYLEVVERNATRLRQLVDDLLLSAQMAHGVPWAAEELDVVEVVRAAVTGLSPMIGNRDVEVRLEGDARVPLRSDAQRLGQVVDNLLSNALKYTLPRTTVDVTVERAETAGGARAATIRVRDHGPGIDPDELSRLTDRFYRTRDTRRRRVRGVGLGLSVVRTIVADHGGTLRFESTPGDGATVQVVLPDLPCGTD
ncbi:ATP-binding protein [Nocardioides sp. zg-DK7169]|uniref:sensor histidine kinase n=1 Tax=Nocardioides sp. zg-DK7169 TaxID=2736600 RepID=UPI001556BFF3|nr:ATP-binding protein [Nocardioides sp. zg-DK7169]NPC98312.1 PAS domain-containing protein [Nocardioides sp. zg-DK7169]